MVEPVRSELPHALNLLEQGRVAEAYAIVRRLAGAGDPEAMFALADMFWRGAGVEQNVALGREIFRRAAAAGHPMATRAYTNLLANGTAGERDWPGALRRLAEEARNDGRRTQMLGLIQKMALTPHGDPAAVPPGQRLSELPLVSLFPGAFTAAECDYLMMVAEPHYEQSVVVEGNAGEVRRPVRTSDGSTFHWLIEDPAIHAINRRLAAISCTDVNQGEALQILRYRPGQEYRPHCDWLEEPNPRVLTALIYLNDEYEGGETAFVKTGLKVRGRKGDAIVFRSMAPGGGLDPMSEHAGLPVTSGTKYLASRWIRLHRHVL